MSDNPEFSDEEEEEELRQPRKKRVDEGREKEVVRVTEILDTSGDEKVKDVGKKVASVKRGRESEKVNRRSEVPKELKRQNEADESVSKRIPRHLLGKGRGKAGLVRMSDGSAGSASEDDMRVKPALSSSARKLRRGWMDTSEEEDGPSGKLTASDLRSRGEKQKRLPDADDESVAPARKKAKRISKDSEEKQVGAGEASLTAEDEDSENELCDSGYSTVYENPSSTEAFDFNGEVWLC